MKSTARPGLIWAGLAVVFLPCVAQANLFVTTGQTGAQVQVDIDHTQFWTYTPSADVTVDGALFVMKRGPKTEADITFQILKAGVPELSVTLTPAKFDQDYDPIWFKAETALDLIAGTEYTAILSSTAPDKQSAAYFIKGGSLFLGDSSGNPVQITSEPLGLTAIPVPTPASSALALMGLAVVGLRRFRAG